MPEIVPRLIAEFAITPEEAEALLPSGRQSTLLNRAHWARTFMGKAGLIASPKRGVYEITAEGRKLLSENPSRIDMNLLWDRYPAYREWREKSAGDADVSTEVVSERLDTGLTVPAVTPDDLIARAFAEINAALTEEVLGLLHSVTPQRFEQVVIDLLGAMGYGGGRADMAERLGRSGDGGIDGVIKEDRLGLDMVYIQAKRYAPENKVGRPAVQGFVGSLTGEGATKGVFVTTSDFSREARDYAARVPQKIVLLNGTDLARLMIEQEIGVRARATFVRRSIDEDYFGEG